MYCTVHLSAVCILYITFNAFSLAYMNMYVMRDHRVVSLAVSYSLYCHVNL